MSAADPALMQGILLAAGFGRRFDPEGRQSKLLATLPDGRTVAGKSAHVLASALPGSIAVIRPGHPALSAELQAAGCVVLESVDAERGMGSALAHAVRETRHANGWLIALADMPWLTTQTVCAVALAVDAPDRIAAAAFRGERGHPVAFGSAHGPALEALHGDRGARALLMAHAPRLVEVNDAGVLLDIDRPIDLAHRAPT